MTASPRREDPGELERARFRSRVNRFVVEAALDGGESVHAHLPNTGRLTHLAVPGRPWILRREHDPGRKTRYTAIRAWDGCWVALEASPASGLLAAWLENGNELPGTGPIEKIEKEVTVGSHRLDLAIHNRNGATTWIEVKSGGRVVDGTALLSETPSERAAAHLDALAGLIDRGDDGAVAFVVQRPDAQRLFVGQPADLGWVSSVRTARRLGVRILAFRCRVTPATAEVEGPIPVLFDDGAD